MYTTLQAATMFSVSRETMRTWAEEFEEHLTPSANPGKGRNRSFTQDDLEVLALVAQMKLDGLMFEDIHRALQRGERGNPPPIDPSLAQQLVRTANDQRAIAQVQELQSQLRQVTEERDRLAREAGRVQELEVQVARLEAEIEALKGQMELREQIGELRGELKALKDKRGE